MVGFSLKKEKVGFSLKKSVKTPLKTWKTEKDDDEETVVKIDTFDNDGAYDQASGPSHKEQLVIKTPGNGDWKRQTKQRFNPTVTKTIEEETQLEYGMNEFEKQDTKPTLSEREILQRDIESRPLEVTEEEYEEVPIEEFGAALLRGMGWKGDDDKDDEKVIVPRPSRLGLGAKFVPGEDDRKKEYLPPMKMVKRDRSRSPKRIDTDYRSRT